MRDPFWYQGQLDQKSNLMTISEIFQVLQGDIHSTVFATVDNHGLPQTCVIDVMLADENGLYFLTAKGKGFYNRLTKQKFVAISGMKGTDTLSTVAISVRGHIHCIGKERLEEIFERYPYMGRIYPTVKSRDALVVFQMDRGEGEYFDLSQMPPYRETFSFGGENSRETGYQINRDKCIGCQECRNICPIGCISSTVPREIDHTHCLHCGNCFSICPVKAVEKIDG